VPRVDSTCMKAEGRGFPAPSTTARPSPNDVWGLQTRLPALAPPGLPPEACLSSSCHNRDSVSIPPIDIIADRKSVFLFQRARSNNRRKGRHRSSANKIVLDPGHRLRAKTALAEHGPPAGRGCVKFDMFGLPILVGALAQALYIAFGVAVGEPERNGSAGSIAAPSDRRAARRQESFRNPMTSPRPCRALRVAHANREQANDRYDLRDRPGRIPWLATGVMDHETRSRPSVFVIDLETL